MRTAIRALCFLTLAFCLFRPTSAHAADPPTDRGVVDQRPTDSRFVKVGDRFMVPYREAIPGTNITFEMIPVPGGTFLMGSPLDEPGHKPDEGPQVRVKVDPMWVGVGEVTQEEYREFEMLYHVFVGIDVPDGTGRSVDTVTAPTQLYDPSLRAEFGDGDKFPAVSMTQFAAQQYTKWLSAVTKRQYRLPCEAEWEYACRGGTASRFSWGGKGSRAGEFAWFDENTMDGFHPGFLKKPNGFGLHDMDGNVGEWTVNAYTSDGYAWLSDKEGRAIRALDTIRWPKQATSCVVRGGRWESPLNALRPAARLESSDDEWKDQDANIPRSAWWFTSEPAISIGFRVFRSYEPLDEPTMMRFWDHTAADVHEAIDQFLEMGRGRVGLLDENLLPSTAAFRVKRASFLRKLKERRELRQRLRSRPTVED